jgi:uncharacterized UBP type Zn finger protein
LEQPGQSKEGDFNAKVLVYFYLLKFINSPEIRALLNAVGKKYDQYLDFAQQDAHEFLRILLDAMSMEEMDVCFLCSSVP